MTEARTIDLTPSWPEAVRILIAALEHGTGTGKQAARAELARMAQILDALADQLDVTPTAFDVIADRDGGTAYGVAFTTDAAAHAYAERMRAHGYNVGAVAELELHTSAADGLADAARFFDAPELKEAGQ